MGEQSLESCSGNLFIVGFTVGITIRQDQTRDVLLCNSEANNLFNNLAVAVVDCLTASLKPNSSLPELCLN